MRPHVESRGGSVRGITRPTKFRVSGGRFLIAENDLDVRYERVTQPFTAFACGREGFSDGFCRIGVQRNHLFERRSTNYIGWDRITMALILSCGEKEGDKDILCLFRAFFFLSRCCAIDHHATTFPLSMKIRLMKKLKRLTAFRRLEIAG